MRVCLFFVWEKPLSLLRRQGRVAAPSIRCALPVSYTHLDVYKRQLHDHGGAEQFGHHRAAAERGPSGRAGRHPQRAGPCRGDVYKRQNLA